MCCPEAPGRPLSAGMPAPPAWAPSAVAPARNARSAFPPGPPAPQPWMRALHLQASWGGAAPRCPMQSSSRSRGVRASGSRRAPHRTARPPAQAFSIQQKWLRRGVAQAARGRFPCGCGGAAVVRSVPVPVGWSAVPEQVASVRTVAWSHPCQPSWLWVPSQPWARGGSAEGAGGGVPLP